MQTEDETLFKLMAPMIQYYAHQMHTRTQSEQTAFIELKEYCTSMAYSKKPQWQVLAERNGWCKKWEKQG